MSYHNLSVESMVGVSSAWVDPEKDRPVFERFPMLAPFVPGVDQAHQDLIRIQVRSSVNAGELKKLSEDAGKLDSVHDRKLRGIYNVLLGFADLADDPKAAEEYLDLLSRLYPDGLRATQRSYLDEAGNVSLVEGRVDDEMTAILDSLPVPGGRLSDELSTWIAKGKELGDVERRRAQLASEKDDESISLTEVNQARLHWIEVVETVMKIIDLVPNMDDESKNRIAQPLKTAEAKADKQRREALAKKDAGSEAEDTPAES